MSKLEIGWKIPTETLQSDISQPDPLRIEVKNHAPCQYSIFLDGNLYALIIYTDEAMEKPRKGLGWSIRSPSIGIPSTAFALS